MERRWGTGDGERESCLAGSGLAVSFLGTGWSRLAGVVCRGRSNLPVPMRSLSSRFPRSGGGIYSRKRVFRTDVACVPSHFARPEKPASRADPSARLSSLLRKSRGRAGRYCAGGQGALTAAMPKRIAKEAQRRSTDARAARPEGCVAFPGGVRWTTADRPPWGMPLSSACSAGKIARNAAHATFSTGC